MHLRHDIQSLLDTNFKRPGTLATAARTTSSSNSSQLLLIGTLSWSLLRHTFFSPFPDMIPYTEMSMGFKSGKVSGHSVLSRVKALSCTDLDGFHLTRTLILLIASGVLTVLARLTGRLPMGPISSYFLMAVDTSHMAMSNLLIISTLTRPLFWVSSWEKFLSVVPWRTAHVPLQEYVLPGFFCGSNNFTWA